MRHMSKSRPVYSKLYEFSICRYRGAETMYGCRGYAAPAESNPRPPQGRIQCSSISQFMLCEVS